MKITVGKKIIFEKKKPAPIQGSGFQRPVHGFPGSQTMGQKPVLRPGPSMYPGISSNISTKKEKPKSITQIIANLPKDELAAYVSVIVGLIFIFIAIIIW
ncbi:hypothetical protein COY26_00315 [Candidatus Woesearchaeota archaeon CG_4_10_14_0_2_um_filter_33_10]|nr:MAG: hypothetical protein COV14_02485 [Candidatus Woesearchaeota archaeon CG10_big_fil_rev_8_21_14_0_10_33_12]PIZ54006.1 MAG: hypothetical protein COY26_00315 [Candidatus Woesearchaeota archaeon CG_4_10_14_0_2_um_filter_33_10]